MKKIKNQFVEVSPAATAKKTSTSHVFVDIDSAKKDIEYELFFMRKEDGTRFFNPALVKNIKKVCGDHIEEHRLDDPLESIGFWSDTHLCATAGQILSSAASFIDHFYHEVKKSAHPDELEKKIGSALMALMLASNPHRAAKLGGTKTSRHYFEDFLNFFRQALETQEYQKLVISPPVKSDKHAHAIFDLTNAVSYALFTNYGYRELYPPIEGLIQEALQEYSSEHDMVSDRLSEEYATMTKLIKHHAHGPLIKLLNILEEGEVQAFDSLFQGNIPGELFSFESGGRKIPNMRIPAPFYQEFIHKPMITEEFKAFVRALKTKYLIISFLDRTSWKEHNRALLLEDLAKKEEKLAVVTLPKDTEFYHQTGRYDKDTHADAFMEHFKEQLADEDCGFYFPKEIKKALFPKFVDQTLNYIHQTFFGGKNVLSRNHRLDFIEIFYLYLEAKLVELVKPSILNLVCKDGVDVSEAANCQLFLFLHWLNGEPLTEKSFQLLSFMVYAPAIMVRERVMHTECFNRMVSTIRTLESVSKFKHRRKIAVSKR